MSPHLVCLIAKEVDCLELLVLHVIQAIGLVPPMWENVKGYLAADRVRQAVVRELLLQDADKLCADAGFLLGSVSGHVGNIVRKEITLSYS
jgi:hypothetical protein